MEMGIMSQEEETYTIQMKLEFGCSSQSGCETLDLAITGSQHTGGYLSED